MRIMLLTGDRKTASAYQEAAEQSNRYRLCVLKTPEQVLERLFRDPFDALLSDDPVIAARDFRRCSVLWPSLTFLILRDPPVVSEYPERLTYCFLNTCEPRQILNEIASFPKGQRLHHDTDHVISRMLQKLGVPVSLSGFDYLREALRLILLCRATDLLPLHVLYEIVAEEMSVTGFAAEHAMRHAIDTAWIRADPMLLECIFGDTIHSERAAPSNAAFLFRIADRIRINGEEEIFK